VKRLLMILFLLFILSTPIYADCQQGLPCGPVPWNVPSFGQLASPTPYPTVIVNLTSTPTQTATPGPGTASAPTATPQLDTSGINNQVGTLQSIIQQTPVATFAPSFGAQNLSTNSQTFFGYVLGLGNVHFGPLTPLLTFFLFSFLYVLGVKLALILLPLLAALFGFFRNIVSLILEFLPF